MINPFAPTENIVMTIQENPFKPTVLAKQPLLGSGGLGSGSFLDVKPGDVVYKKRRSDQVKNAQRLYRQLNRDKYNEYMKNFTKKYYDTNPDKKKERDASMSLANDKYRMKQKINKIQQQGDELIEKEAKIMWKNDKSKPQRPKGRPKKNKDGTTVKFDDSMPKDYIQKNYEKLYDNMLKSAHISRSEVDRLGLSLDGDVEIVKMKPTSDKGEGGRPIYNKVDHLTDFDFSYVDKEGKLFNDDDYKKVYNLKPERVEEYWNDTVIPEAKRRAKETPAQRLARKEKAAKNKQLRYKNK
jgi:hypothetical protein